MLQPTFQWASGLIMARSWIPRALAGLVPRDSGVQIVSTLPTALASVPDWESLEGSGTFGENEVRQPRALFIVFAGGAGA